jgi:hypothetical protein
VTFDDIPANLSFIPNCYDNIHWENGYYVYGSVNGNASGYHTAAVNESNLLYNGGGNPMTMTSADGRLFILNSAVVAAAWNDNLLLTVVGYHSNVIIQNQTFILEVFTASYLNFSGYSGVDTVVFSTSGGTKNPHVVASGMQFGMDNICLTFI